MVTVQVIISKDLDLEGEELASYMNNGILSIVSDEGWTIDNISMV